MSTKNKMAAVAAAILLITGGIASAQDAAMNKRKPAVADQDLVIKITDISENALFYPAVIDGMKMEALAVKAPDGTVRTAFNACHVCCNSGKGCFVQEGAVLVCQNCGRRFRMSQAERQAGGCNPETVFPANKTVTGPTITISMEYMKRAKTAFESRKKS